MNILKWFYRVFFSSSSKRISGLVASDFVLSKGKVAACIEIEKGIYQLIVLDGKNN